MAAYELAMQIPGKQGYVFMSFDTYTDLKFYYINMPVLVPRDESSTIGVVKRGVGLGQGMNYYRDFQPLETDDSTDTNRYCYEIINGKRCPYWDFDGYLDDGDIIEITDAIKAELAPQYSICINLYNSNGKKPDGELKYSYHVIVKGVAMPDHRSCEELCKRIVSKCKSERIRSEFDSGVYSSKRNFRLLGSRKLGDNRIKVHDRLLYSSPNFRSAFIGDALYMSMSSAYIDSTPYAVCIQPERATSTNGITANDIEEIRHLVTEHFRDEFEIGRITNGILTLSRRKSGYCTICSRVHDKSDAFITVYNRLFQFRCYRNTRAPPIVLNQEDEEDIPIAILDDCDDTSKAQANTACSVPIEQERMIKHRFGETTLREYAARLRRIYGWSNQ